jgi:glyoxylase-like metal-dependent hydrolase (beta-lactamase superfamily II)
MLSRRRFLYLSGVALTAAPWLPAAFPPRRTLPFQTLRRNVGIFTERGGTIGWLAHGDALVVVDTQYPEPAEVCWRGLQERTSRPADLVINTHHHGDHTGGNPFFEAHTDRILAHENVPGLQRQSAAQRGNADTQVYPNETFASDWTEAFGDETVRLRHYGPAHTGGDAVIHFEQANVVHVGDLVFNRVYPFIDIDGGASVQGWIRTMEQIHADFDDDTRFVFGHGNPAYGITGDRADLLVMRDFLSSLVEYVQNGIDEGQSAAALADRQVLPGFEAHYVEDWSLELGACIRAVHRDLTAPDG